MENSKHQAVWNFISQYKGIKNQYFNFSQSNNDDTIIAPSTAYNDYWKNGEPFIDGSGFKNYDFAIIQYKPYSTEPNSCENIEILEELEELAKWIDEQGEKHNYPIFPDNCKIIDIYALPSNTGYIAGADDKEVKYMLEIRIEYLYERTL